MPRVSAIIKFFTFNATLCILFTFIMTSFDNVMVVKKSLETMETNRVNLSTSPWQQDREMTVTMETREQQRDRVTMDTGNANTSRRQPDGTTEEEVNEFIPG